VVSQILPSGLGSATSRASVSTTRSGWAWIANLEASSDEAVGEVARAGRGRGVWTWRLRCFQAGRTQVHQVLAVRLDRGRSRLPLPPRDLLMRSNILATASEGRSGSRTTHGKS
jgi:hypothetical protein